MERAPFSPFDGRMQFNDLAAGNVEVGYKTGPTTPSQIGGVRTAAWSDHGSAACSHNPGWPVFIVSPLATLALQLCVVGQTGLKTGWVSCRHGAGRGGAGWGGVG